MQLDEGTGRIEIEGPGGKLRLWAKQGRTLAQAQRATFMNWGIASVVGAMLLAYQTHGSEAAIMFGGCMLILPRLLAVTLSPWFFLKR